jgi:hypothetical protein
MKVIPGKMTPDNIYLFPFQHPDPRMMKRISILLGRPTICLPWHMEDLADEGDGATTDLPRVIRPPEDLRPREDFPRLLQEYRKWMRENPDRSCPAFLAAREMHPAEETHWEIQRMVRRGTGDRRIEQKRASSLKWHLLLRLAWELEKERRDAEAALQHLRDHDSPLKEALGEDLGGPGLMDDLSESLAGPVFEHRLLEDSCEAWLNLFETSVNRESILVTHNEKILFFVRELFEEALSRVDEMRAIPFLSFHVTDPLSFPPQEPGESMRADPAGRANLIIREIIETLQREGSLDPDVLSAQISAMDELLPSHSTPDLLRVELLSLPKVKGPIPSQWRTIMNGLSGRTLVFFDGISRNG